MDDYFLSEYDFRSMVIDEAHRLKNPKRYLICPLVCVCVCVCVSPYGTWYCSHEASVALKQGRVQRAGS